MNKTKKKNVKIEKDILNQSFEKKERKYEMHFNTMLELKLAVNWCEKYFQKSLPTFANYLSGKKMQKYIF